MLEVTLIFVVMISIATTAFLPLGYSLYSDDQNKSENNRHISQFDRNESSPLSAIPEDSTLKRHFVTQLRAEIIDIYPSRPTDSTLGRHYDGLISAELERKLEELSA